MDSILQRIQASQRSNPVLNKAANGGVITEQSEKSAKLATDMVEGATNIPDVTQDNNPAPIADLGSSPEKAGNEVTPAVPTNPNEENPDVQEILDAKEVVVKTANAILPIAQAFSNLSVTEIDAMFNKQASAEDFTNEQVITMIDKMASQGNPVALAFVDFCNGYAQTMQKIANDTAALMEQGVPAEEAEAIAAQAAIEGAPEATEAAEGAEEVPADVATDVGAELEAVVAEITAEAAAEIMEVVPEATPEEAQAMAEELVSEQLMAEMGGEGMEQTASAEDGVEEETEVQTEDIPEDTTEDIDGAIAEALDELTSEATAEIMEVIPEATPEEAAQLAAELIEQNISSELSGVMGEGMEQTASAEEAIDAGAINQEDILTEATEVLDELVNATAADIRAAAPELSPEEATELATEAVMDAVATASEQEAIGITDENGEYAVPDEVAAESIEDMIKTASANPLRAALTPVVATLFGVDQDAFINRINK